MIANVDTNKKYQRLGLATKLINEIYSDLKNDHNGIYVFVKINNKNALSLYKKCNFSILKRYTLDKEIYYIMYRGDKSKLNQFENISFGG